MRMNEIDETLDLVERVSDQIDLLTELRDKNVINDRECADKIEILMTEAGINLTCEEKEGQNES